ncbi:hotdog fold thioesterase [Sphingomonas astaxanthinifaciens]|uniref:Esterase n=1 Tax=Sphingomonas astaxanthinifaciens DSM 22298 TaxID=1123267 RepID=A0ABQ5Z7B1_9SPHN|nr:hotdog fold thioesterase [Sphingomonas astaxanthinifaciens]GLR47901.1 putative esterase [Sphingomonas astaxanthinifaciens DSM 22298]
MSIWHSDDFDPDAASAFGDSSMPGHLGIRITARGENWLEATMPVDRRTHQPFGRLHGGASVALAETVASVAGFMTVDPAEKATVGLEINANHIRPVRDGIVTARAIAEAIGRTTQVWTIRITDERDKLVCLSRITLAVIPVNQA